MARLTSTWTTYVPKVYKRYPELLAEMFAYSMAAAHEELPHFTYEHFMVSNTNMYGEGWPFIDALEDDVCVPPVNGIYYPALPLPTFLHYCQFFRIGELGFQKRRLPKSIFQCDKPMMAETPRNLASLTYKNRDGEVRYLFVRHGHAVSFMIFVAFKFLIFTPNVQQ